MEGIAYSARKLDSFGPVAVVRSLDEAIPALIAYFWKHPPPWEGTATRTKLTGYGVLDVEQEQSGRWVARFNGDPLLRDGKPALFATREEAQRLADLHVSDGFDGYAWACRSADQHVVAPTTPATMNTIAAANRTGSL